MRFVRQICVLSIILAAAPLCFASGIEGEPNHLSASEVVAPETLTEAAESFLTLGRAELPAVREMAPDELAAVADFFDELTPDWMADVEPMSASSGCYYACFDAQTSSQFCPPGQLFAMEATGPFNNCYIVGGSTCLSSGCTVLVSSCRGFAPSCNGFP